MAEGKRHKNEWLIKCLANLCLPDGLSVLTPWLRRAFCPDHVGLSWSKSATQTYDTESSSEQHIIPTTCHSPVVNQLDNREDKQAVGADKELPGGSFPQRISLSHINAFSGWSTFHIITAHACKPTHNRSVEIEISAFLNVK